MGKGNAEAAEQALVLEGKGRRVHWFSLAEGKGTGPEAAVGEEILDIVAVAPGELWWGHRTVEPWGWGVPGGIGARLDHHWGVLRSLARDAVCFITSQMCGMAVTPSGSVG